MTTDNTTDNGAADDNDLIVISLTDEEWRAIVEVFIFAQLRPTARETFQEALALGRTIEEASYDVLRNEAVNYALELEVGRLQADSVIHMDGEFDDSDYVDPRPAPSKMIWVTFQKEGVHLYPAAATDPKLATGGWDDVSFLGVPHRHIFHFRVSMEVFHDDRDVEFIQFKRWLERLYSEGTLELNHKSCEMISDDLHAAIVAQYPGRKIIIEVSEDGENGSTAEYPA
jgi:hypothetical protein